MRILKNKKGSVSILTLIGVLFVIWMLMRLLNVGTDTRTTISEVIEYDSVINTQKYETIGKVIRKEKIENLLFDDYYLILEDDSHVFKKKVKSEDYVLYTSGDTYKEYVTKRLPITVLAKDKITYEDKTIYFSKISTANGELILRIREESYPLVSVSETNITEGEDDFPAEVRVRSQITTRDPYYDLVLEKLKN